jgi:hypothetical protein
MLSAGADEPIVSVKLDVHVGQIHVTRGLLIHAWEGYDAGGGVIESREIVKWTRELVGTIRLADFPDLESVRDELICLIWQAVVGTSRLPLISVEAPLPAFVFGELHYGHRADAGDTPCQSWADFLAGGLRSTNAFAENVKLIEFTLRHLETARLPELVDILKQSSCRAELPGIFGQMFNDVSLSPYTRFVDDALECWDLLARQGVIDLDTKIDFLSRLLRQVCRHLTAYDLVTFHHRGANYPDALLLDELLTHYLREIDARPERFLGADNRSRLRRRALRQGCLLRRHYEGHLVPDLPTSPGENARVLAASHPRVPEEQLTQPRRRRRQLFADEPLPALLSPQARQGLDRGLRDLTLLDERVEMGLGVFIDRPLGYAKAVAEPDLTPLLAHEAFSPSLARRRWQEVKALCQTLAIAFDATQLDECFANGVWPAGLAHTVLANCPRPTAALADVRQVAEDFVILRTLPGGLRVVLDFLAAVHALPAPTDWRCRLCVQVVDGESGMRLALYDERLERRWEIACSGSAGYITRAGVELPRSISIGVSAEPAAVDQ